MAEKKTRSSRAANARAKAVDAEVREVMRNMERLWIRIGKLCEECRAGQLWKHLGFADFKSWLEDAVGMSRSRVYVAMRAVRELGVSIRDADLEAMTLQNADILSRVPASKRRGLVRAAQTQTEQDFRRTVEQAVPGLHDEASVHIEFWVPRSLAEVVERVITLAMALNNTDSRTVALEDIFTDYETSHQVSGQNSETDGRRASERMNETGAGGASDADNETDKTSACDSVGESDSLYRSDGLGENE